MSTSARRIRITNPDLSSSEKTQLDADYTSGTALTVIANSGFADDDIAVVGEPGSEKTEADDVSGITSSTQIDITNGLNFAHQSSTPIYRSEYDQVEISKMAAGGAWSVLSTIDIDWDNDETLYVDQGGINTDSYRFRFYNSASTNYSEYSPTITGSGFAKNSVGRMVQNVRLTINDPDRKIVSDNEIINFLVMAKDIVRAKRSDWWFWLKEDEGTITTVANQRNYNLDDISSNIEYVKDVRFRDASQTPVEIYHIEYKPSVEFDYYVIDQSEQADDTIDIYTIKPGDENSTAGYISVDPKPETTGNGSFYLRYYQPDTDFDDVSDTTAIPVPHILELFAISKCEQLKGNDERAAVYESLFHGPASKTRDLSKMTGIALLEQMQIEKLKPTGQPRQFKRFRGRNPVGRFYRSRMSTNIDNIREKYW